MTHIYVSDQTDRLRPQ